MGVCKVSVVSLSDNQLNAAFKSSSDVRTYE